MLRSALSEESSDRAPTSWQAVRVRLAWYLPVMIAPPFVPAQRGRYERCATAWLIALLALAQAACLPSWLRFERFRHGGCWHDHEVAALDPRAGVLVLHFGDVIEVPSGTIGVGEGWPYGVSSMPFSPTGVDDADEQTRRPKPGGATGRPPGEMPAAARCSLAVACRACGLECPGSRSSAGCAPKDCACA